ncbi:hypothetical protein [Dactylosporangium salmoneum]|uniref:Uncharacterized protein n=1 Tax=Dactylosporangium salmoneum TaxID=53361 RepID=A0ABN3G9W4_9ACTN
MTQTYRSTLGRRASARRPGHVYLYPTFRVDQAGMPCGDVENGYVGKSARPFGVRDDEHRRGKGGDPALVSPWSDLATPGSPVILESGMYTDAELDERERYWIAKLQPRYNDRGNEARGDRIRKLEARRHRDSRDVARGLTPRQWAPLRVDPVTPAKSAKWRHRRNRALTYAAVWPALTGLLWLLSAAAGLTVPGRTFPIAATGAVALQPLLRACKRRERQLIVAVITVACALLWLVTG